MRHDKLARRAAPAAAILWLTVSSSAIGQGSVRPGRPLAADSVIEGSLPQGAADVYPVVLGTGQFLRITVEQRALDVRVRLLDAGGSALVASDTMNGAFGVERLAFVARAAGEYRVEVSTSAAAPEGRYVLRVLALREASPADARHAAAEGVYAEAEALRRQNTADARAAAVAKYHETAEAFRSLGLTYEAAMSLYSAGIQQLSGGQTRAAEADLSAALPMVRALNDPLLPSVVNALGGAYDLLGEPARAMESYREALGIFRANGNRNGEANALNNIGKVYGDLADWQQALEYYRLALPIWRTQRDVVREGITLHNIGFAYFNAGDADRGLEYFGQALERRRTAGNKAGEADTLGAMGLVETRRGDNRKALAYYDQALTLRRAVGDRRAEASTLDYVGRTHVDIGDPAGALTFFELALPLQRASGDRRLEGMTLGNLASAYSALGRHAEALDRARQALAILRDVGDRSSTAGVLHIVARAERDLGELDAAAGHAAEALRTIEEVRGGVASRQLRTSYFASQHDISMFYVDLLMRQHDRDPAKGFDVRALEASERSRARALIELLAESGTAVRRGADPALLERERDVSERLSTKSARLVGLLARGSRSPEADTLSKEVRGLESEYDDIQTALRQTSPAYATITQSPPIDVTAMQRDILDPRTIVLEYALGEEASYLWAIEQRRIRSYRLPPRAAIEQATREAYGFVTARGTSVPGETAAARRDRIARADAALPAALRRLSATILAPVLPLADNARLVLVADGALEYFPFAILPAGGARSAEPLVARAEIVGIPSASTLSTQRATLAGRRPAAHMLAIVADPVFDVSDPRVRPTGPTSPAKRDDDRARLLQHLAAADGSSATVIPRLPFTSTEAAAIAAAVGGSGNLSATGFDARKDALLGDRLKDYRYVHFATHGFIDTDNPSLSALVLSLVDREGQPLDGFLRADELYGLDLSADLVVLSACQTGLGKSIKGEGIVGLTRGLMYAGAARVIVSLWSVSDRATADLMSRLYREMVGAGRTPAAALRAAQIAMWKTAPNRSPYYWAAFTLQGDWK